MKVRYNFLPTTVFDYMCTITTAIGIPLTFYVEAFLVLPEFHSPGTLPHQSTLFIGLYLLFNAEMNFLVLLMTDKYQG